MTNTKPIEYCYSLDEECYAYTDFGGVLDELESETDSPIGAVYYCGEKVALTHAECFDVDRFLESCDEWAYEEIGEIYENCFADVDASAKTELGELIAEWAKKHVNLRFWKVTNSQRMTITAEDLE